MVEVEHQEKAAVYRNGIILWQMSPFHNMNSMALRVFATAVACSVGCSPSEDDSITDRAKDDETRIEDAPAALPKRDLSNEDLDRIREIEVAIAMWYSRQASAAAQLERHEGVEFGPITFERDPQVIITEQRRNVRLIIVLDESERDEVKRSMAFWCAQQLEAANLLRHALGKEEIASGEESDPASFLHEQEKDLVALKSEAKEILGYEYWVSRAPFSGMRDGKKN